MKVGIADLRLRDHLQDLAPDRLTLRQLYELCGIETTIIFRWIRMRKVPHTLEPCVTTGIKSVTFHRSDWIDRALCPRSEFRNYRLLHNIVVKYFRSTEKLRHLKKVTELYHEHDNTPIS